MENKEKESPEVLEQPQTSEENTTEQHEEDVKFAHDMLEGDDHRRAGSILRG